MCCEVQINHGVGHLGIYALFVLFCNFTELISFQGRGFVVMKFDRMSAVVSQYARNQFTMVAGALQ